MLRYFDNPMNKNIYKVGLFSIDEDALIYIDLSRKDNIYNMKDKFVKEIFVQETLNNNYVREIITGILIPVRKEEVSIRYIYSEVEGCCPLISNYSPYKNIPFSMTNSLTYVKRVKNIDGDNISYIYIYKDINLRSSSYIVNGSELTNYFKYHNDINMFKEALSYIFLKGEEIYQDKLNEGNFSDCSKSNNKLVKKIRNLDLDNITPIKAINILSEIKELISYYE